MATLAPNLDRARAAIERAFPGTTIYWIGDQAHAAERSDHNPDARGIVHAIDVMLAEGDERGDAVVRAAVGRPDLQYVIHDRTIWSRSWGWGAQPYTGSDPHTNHVHISGKHGTVGATPYTEAGYDVAAEQDQTPWVIALPEEIDMTPDQDMLLKKVERYLYCLFEGIDAKGQFGMPDGGQLANAVHADLAALKSAPPVVLSDAQLDTVAQKVAALIAPLVTSPAAAVADELAHRLGNG